MSSVIVSPQFSEVLELLNHGSAHLFITGKAGTGKSTLLQYFRKQTDKALVVLAPTGVAAVNVEGETIHSFFKFPPNITKADAEKNARFTKKPEIYKKLEMIVIDEISMVRSDLLDCVDLFLRTVRGSGVPFGGVRMVFFGDLYQLPPVVASGEYETFRTMYQSEWFFDAVVMHEIIEGEAAKFMLVELETIYRQTDQDFIDLLAAIRLRTVQEHHLLMLNERVQSYDERNDIKIPPITLTGRRNTAAEINAKHLAQLSGQARVYTGDHTGKFPEGHLPTEGELSLKVGARVMFVANDSAGAFVNGTLGTVTALKPSSVLIDIDGKGVSEIEEHTWELSHTVLSKNQELEKKKVGSFTQLPLMLAWAVTVHKSQGKTFDNVVINLDRGAFAHGQVYVALSRCRTFEGISLVQPVTLNDIKMNWRVSQFLTSFAYRQAALEQSPEEKFQLIQDAIEMQSTVTITYLRDLNEKSVRKIFPKVLKQMTYQGRAFVGLKAFCTESQADMTFSAEKILKVS